MTSTTTYSLEPLISGVDDYLIDVAAFVAVHGLNARNARDLALAVRDEYHAGNLESENTDTIARIIDITRIWNTGRTIDNINTTRL